MEKRMLLSGIVLMLLSLSGSSALALDPMGPPVAGLSKGQFSAGIEFLHGTTDLRLDGTVRDWNYIDGVPEPDLNYSGPVSTRYGNEWAGKVYGRVGYGITDNWEAFVRFGGAESIVFQAWGWAFGLGTKATFLQADGFKLGGLFQVSSAHCSHTEEDTDQWAWGPEYDYDKLKCDIIEIQVAVGASHQLTNRVSIYGGPFFHFVDGDLQEESRGNWWSTPDEVRSYRNKWSYDIDEASNLGGYIGAEINVAENVCFNVEYQHTPNADAVSTSLICRSR